MTQEGQVTQNFLEALLTCDESNLQKVLDPDATLRIYGHQGLEVHRSLTRIAQRLTAESAQWSTPWLEIFTNQTTGSKTAVEFRIQATENGRYIEHNRAAFFTIEAGHIKTIEMYCPEPIPSAHRKNHIASADLSDQELTRLFDSYLFHHDVRMGVPPGLSGRLNLRCLMIGRGGSHPDENTILGVRWTAEEADAKIQSVINHHKEKGIGFTWSISPYDTPSDLAQRPRLRARIASTPVTLSS